MGQKKYLDNSYIKNFDAKITSEAKSDDGVVITLEENYFYPESGGQPSDSGHIGSAKVLGVQLRGDDVEIHLDRYPDGPKAEINWNKRYDHMQQHTAQHLLSATIIELFDADTIAFHLGESISTIDLNLNGFSQERIKKVEECCSKYIRDALPVSADTVTVEKFKALPLRKKALPDHIQGDIRLIKIGEVDTAHCGGTHLKSTAEIQMLKIVATENVKNHVRIHFIAGNRVLEDYGRKHKYLVDIADSLTCSTWDIDKIIAKTRAENKESKSQLKKISKELASYKAGEELENAESAGKFVIVAKIYDDFNPRELKAVGSEMTAKKDNLLFCGIGRFKGKAAVVLAAGNSFKGDLGEVCRQIMPLINGKGGGRGPFAQGMGELDNIETVIEKAKKLLKETGEKQ